MEGWRERKRGKKYDVTFSWAPNLQYISVTELGLVRGRFSWPQLYGDMMGRERGENTTDRG